jgi:hypothetical protein
MFRLRISSLILRWYFMMLVGIIAVYTQQDWLIFVTVLIAVSAVLGYSIQPPKEKESAQVINIDEKTPTTKRKAS